MMQICCSESDCSGHNCIQLTERELMVCGIVCGSSEPVTYSSLKKHSGLHQAVLTRIIHMLESHKVIEKVDVKYRKVG